MSTGYERYRYLLERSDDQHSDGVAYSGSGVETHHNSEDILTVWTIARCGTSPL